MRPRRHRPLVHNIQQTFRYPQSRLPSNLASESDGAEVGSRPTRSLRGTHMALYINNGSSETINVSLLLYDPTCKVGSQPWRKEAWWVINSGQTVKPNALDVNLTTVN